MLGRSGPWIAVVGLFAFMGVASFAQRGDDDLRAGLQRYVDRMRVRPDRAEGARTPLWDGRDGSAMEVYRTAMLAKPAVAATDAAASRAAWAPVWDLLHEAACCRQRGARTGKEIAWGDLLEITRIEWAARLAEGDAEGAVVCWLDGAVAWRDINDGNRDLCSLVPIADDALRTLPSGALRKLAEGLVRLEADAAAWDPEAAVPREIAALLSGRRFSSDAASARWTWRQRSRAWATGFDAERWELEQCAQLVGALPLLQPVDATFAGREAQRASFEAARPKAPNSRADQLGAWVLGRETTARWQVAQIRLLRLAIAFHLREPLPELTDPFADAPLRAVADEHSAAFRSAGAGYAIERFATRR